MLKTKDYNVPLWMRYPLLLQQIKQSKIDGHLTICECDVIYDVSVII